MRMCSREVLSRRCVLVKRVPEGVEEECLQRIRGIENSHRHNEGSIDSGEVRWIVLLKSQEEAENLIRDGYVSLNADGQKLDLPVGGCPECIIPDEWVENTPTRTSASFSFDNMLDSIGMESKRCREENKHPDAEKVIQRGHVSLNFYGQKFDLPVGDCPKNIIPDNWVKNTPSRSNAPLCFDTLEFESIGMESIRLGEENKHDIDDYLKVEKVKEVEKPEEIESQDIYIPSFVIPAISSKYNPINTNQTASDVVINEQTTPHYQARQKTYAQVVSQRDSGSPMALLQKPGYHRTAFQKSGGPKETNQTVGSQRVTAQGVKNQTSRNRETETHGAVYQNVEMFRPEQCPNPGFMIAPQGEPSGMMNQQNQKNQHGVMSASFMIREPEADDQEIQGFPPSFFPLQQRTVQGNIVQPGGEKSFDTVRVRLRKPMSQDAIENYFENTRKSGGGEIKSFKTVKKEDENILEALITFRQSSDAKTCLQKKHKIGEVNLTEEKYDINDPEMWEMNKVMVDKLNPVTTDDRLMNFLEPAAGVDPVEVVRGSKPNTVVVVFDEKPDFCEMSKRCNSKKLEGNTLLIQMVEKCRTVYVKDIDDSIDLDTVENFFCNRRRSGGGEVEDVDYHPEDGYCVVKFENPADAENVALRKMFTIYGKEITARIFYPCLGLPEQPINWGNLPSFSVDCNKHILKFVRRCKSVGEEIEETLRQKFVQVEWPNSESDLKVKLLCSLSKEVKNARGILKTWKEEANKSMKRLMDKFVFQELSVFPEVWENFLAQLKTIYIDHLEKVAVLVDANHYAVAVVAFEENAEALIGRLLDLIETEELKIKTQKAKRKERKLSTDMDSDDRKLKELNVEVRQGDITQEKTDAIVSCITESLDLSIGAASKAVLKAAGASILEECHREAKSFSSKGYLVTSGGRMACKYIIHVKAQYKAEGWECMVAKALTHADKIGCRSISFPALGTGIGNINPAEIAKCMLKAIRKFVPENLETMRVIVFLRFMVPIFTSTLRTLPQRALPQAKENFAGAMEVDLSFGEEDEKNSPWHRHKNHYLGNRVNRGQGYGRGEVDKRIIFEESISYLDRELKIEREKKDIDVSKYTLSDKQINEIKRIAKDTIVIIKDGKVELMGLATYVNETAVAIYKYLHEVKDKESAQTVQNYVKWHYEPSLDKWTAFSEDVNLHIENAYHAKKESCTVKDSVGNEYVIDFKKMEEHEKYNYSKTYKIKRAVKGTSSVGLPTNWSYMKSNETMVEITLTRWDNEFKEVMSKFKVSSKGVVSVSEIRRVQNPLLYQQYAAKRKEIELRNGKDPEQWLWHGTYPETVDKVINNGFNRRYCGKNATVYGAGVYFAVNASYSVRYCSTDSNGHKHMFLVQVATGDACRGNSSMNVLPPKPGAGSHVTYDSACDNPSNPLMYVIFHDSQAYPAYHIIFK